MRNLNQAGPLDDLVRRALKPPRRADPNLSPYALTSSWHAIDAYQGKAASRTEIARKDFIFTPLFTLLVGTGGFSIFGTTISYASILTAVATTAVTFGINYLLAPKPPKPEDGRAPLTQPIPYQFWAVGICRLAGAMMLWESVGEKMLSVQAITGHSIDGYESYYLHDDVVTLNVDGGVISPGNGRYGDGTPFRVHLYPRLGAVPETAIAEIVAVLGADGVWTDDHRGDGQASLGMICTAPSAENFGKVFPYGKPAASVVVRGAKVWDFRDEDQDPDDPSTWEFSSNPVLILAWHECFSPFGSQRDFRTAILPVLDMWQEEADVCDEPIDLAIGGTEPRYECGGFETTDKDPKSATNAILASMDGWMCERGDGALLVVAGKFREKYVATVTDADVLGYVRQNDVLFEEEVNRLVPTFTYPATGYTTTDTDHFEDTAAQLLAGRALPQQANYTWARSWRQARRLGKRDWLRIREKKRGSVYLRFTGLNAVYAPWVLFETPLRPMLDGMLVANKRSVLDLNKGGFEMSFMKMPDDIDAWVPATDEGTAPPVPTKPEFEGVPLAVIDTISAISTGSSVFLRIALVDPSRDDLTPVIRYRVADIGGGTPGPWVEQRFPGVTPAGGLLVLDTNPVPSDQDLEVEANFIGANGSYGETWSATESVTTTINTTPPADLTSVSVTGNQLGHFDVAYTVPVSNAPQRVGIFAAPANTAIDFDNPAHLREIIQVNPGQSYARVIGDDTVVNAMTNPDMATDTGYTKGTGWTHNAGGYYQKTAGTGSDLAQTMTALTPGDVLRVGITVTAHSAGSVVQRMTGGATVAGANSLSGTGVLLNRLVATAAHTSIAIARGDGSFAGSVDNAVRFLETPDCHAQGVFDVAVVGLNSSNVLGTPDQTDDVLVY